MGGYGGELLSLETTGLLTYDAQPGGTKLVDSCNGLNKLIRLVILWAVRHRWPAGARFSFSCYRHWSQVLFRHSIGALVILLIPERVTQVDPLSMVLYGITLVLLLEELKGADPPFLPPFYANDVKFDQSSSWSAAQLCLLMNPGGRPLILPSAIQVNYHGQ